MAKYSYFDRASGNFPFPQDWNASCKSDGVQYRGIAVIVAGTAARDLAVSRVTARALGADSVARRGWGDAHQF